MPHEPAWRIEARHRLAAKIGEQPNPAPRWARNTTDRDRVKELAEGDFFGLFEAVGGQRRGELLHCPFHGDRTPSAEIWEGHFHCWSCDARLDPFAFVMQARGMNFRDALRYLADRYHVPLNGSKPLTAAERAAYARIEVEARKEGRAMVGWRNGLLAALRQLRDDYLGSYHRALQLILRYSLAHPRGSLWADVADCCETKYMEMDDRLAVLRRARWSDLLPHFRERSAA